MDSETQQTVEQAVLEILSSADMEEMTEYKVRTLAAERLGIDLSLPDRKRFVRSVVESFLASHKEDTADILQEKQQQKEVTAVEEAEEEKKDGQARRSRAKEYDDEGDLIVCWLSNKRRVTVQDFRGKTLVSIREYYEKEGKQLPSSKGTGTNAGEGTFLHKVEAASVARDCLLAAAKADPKSGPLWINLSNAYYLIRDYKKAKRCAEKAAKLEPNLMSARYAIALQRVKDAERFQECSDQISWAANEIASILKEGDPAMIDLPLTWAGLAMIHRVEHEIMAAYESGRKELADVEERALYTLKQAIEEDPNDAVHWHQFGLHNLRVLQFNASVRFLKAAVARCLECSYAWSNLGVALQLSDDPTFSEQIYKHALSLATPQQAHAILSNLGNLFRQQRRFEYAMMMFAKSLEICPGYALAHNNLGLVYAAEGRWQDAINCFEKALQSDPLLDAAKSNLIKGVSMLNIVGSD